MNFIELSHPHALADLISIDQIVETQYDLEKYKINRLVWHTQDVQPEDTFLAIPSLKNPAQLHINIQQAISKGAKVIICQHDQYNIQDHNNTAFITVKNIKALRAYMAKQIFPKQPQHVVAVTGTNGKTSVVQFCYQLWQLLGCQTACNGSLGLHSTINIHKINSAEFLNTLDPFVLHYTLDALAKAGITHMAFEASSHGIDQYRMHAVELMAAGFTNLSQDHLDYHGTMRDYFEAKLKLFTQVLQPRAIAVLNADSDVYHDLTKAALSHDLRVFSYARKKSDLHLKNIKIENFQQIVTIHYQNQDYTILFKLVGEFQIMNALCAAGLVMATGFSANQVLPLLSQLKPVSGRLNCIGKTKNGAAVFIDYAHTPDALQTVLMALRPFTDTSLTVVFGCGGDRDSSKRLLMGQVAHALADCQIVTDDNPRYENPAQIRCMIMESAPNAQEIGDRRTAIEYALDRAKAKDIVIIAGKGHETYQIIAGMKHDFDDSTIVTNYLTQHGGQLD